MTVEHTVSEVQTHQGQLPLGDHDGPSEHSSHDGLNVPHGMGLSKSSRRRRRKRKGKGADGAGEGHMAEVGGGDSIPVVQDSAPAANSAGNGFQGNGHNAFQNNGQQAHQQNGGSTSGKRWKKKFRDRDRQQRPAVSFDGSGGTANISAGAAPQQNNGGGNPRPFRDANSHQPGNGGGFKRKGGGGGKQQQSRGPRSFVGPMDHSYRAANGNFAEMPPSTIEPQGNYGGRAARLSYQSDSQPIDYSQGRPVAIAEDAPTKIYFFIEDLFFIAKIQETARKLGVKVAFIKNDKESVAALLGHEEDDRPGLIVFDLNNANAKPMTLIPKLKAKLKKGTSVVGFLSHLQGDLKAKAVEAGCDTVMPRAAFSQNLPNLLRRYGIVDEDEPNFNQ